MITEKKDRMFCIRLLPSMLEKIRFKERVTGLKFSDFINAHLDLFMAEDKMQKLYDDICYCKLCKDKFIPQTMAAVEFSRKYYADEQINDDDEHTNSCAYIMVCQSCLNKIMLSKGEGLIGDALEVWEKYIWEIKTNENPKYHTEPYTRGWINFWECPLSLSDVNKEDCESIKTILEQIKSNPLMPYGSEKGLFWYKSRQNLEFFAI
jgi:hypothetical protein